MNMDESQVTKANEFHLHKILNIGEKNNLN